MVAALGVLVLVGSTSVSPAAPVPAPEHSAAPDRSIRIVQLGDSYSAGNGAGDYRGPKGCYRSGESWGERYARWLREQDYAVSFANRACNGGVIRDVRKTREFKPETINVAAPRGALASDPAVRAALERACIRYPEEEKVADLTKIKIMRAPRSGVRYASGSCVRTLEPQWNAVTRETDLVLMTVGGNDAQFAEIVKQCFVPGLRDVASCQKHITFAEDHLDDIQEDLTQLLKDLRAGDRLRADAKVVVLTYPYLSLLTSWTLRSFQAQVPFAGGDSVDAGKKVREVGRRGDSMQRAAVNAANAEAGTQYVTLVDSVKAHFAGHEPHPAATVVNPFRWLHEIERLTEEENYHPNDRGHAEEDALLHAYGDFGAVVTPGAPTPAVDLVFVVDTTSSMAPFIEDAKQLTNQLVDLLVARTGSYRFALVTYRDHPEWTSLSEDYPARVDLRFTTSTPAIHDALSAMAAAGGGDTPESVYSGLRTALGLPWRQYVRKVIIQIGDAGPHDPEPVTGLTASDVIRHSLALDPVEVYPIGTTGPPESELREVASGTGGTVQDSADISVGDTLLTTLTEALAKPHAWVGGPYVAKVGETVELDASGSFDVDGTITGYEWDLSGDGVFDDTTTEPRLNHVWTGPFQGVVVLRVTDSDGATGIASAHLAVTADGDELDELNDNCPTAENPAQADADGDGLGDACDSDGPPSRMDLPGVVGEGDRELAGRSSIEGTVFLDDNGDGVRQGGEAGVRDAVVRLRGVDAVGDRTTLSAITDAGGRWAFPALLPGQYRLEAPQPPGTADGADGIGTIRAGGPGASAGVARSEPGGPDGPIDVVDGIVLSGSASAAVGYSFGERGMPLLRRDWYALAAAVALSLAAIAGAIVVLFRRRRSRVGRHPAGARRGLAGGE
jgi:lysophospholipase L1-like esterase